MAAQAQPEPGTALVESKSISALLMTPEARRVITPMLPRGVEYDRVVQNVYLVAKENPSILECTPWSIIRAVARAESWGLTIGETVHLVPFNVKVSAKNEKPERWEKQAKAIQDYKGKIDLIVRSGSARSVNPECVYEGDFFEMELGTDPWIRHRPEREPAKRGKMVGAYAVADLGARFKPVIKWMTVAEIEEIRLQHSKQWKDGALKPWYARKTTVHQLGKILPKSERLAAVLRMFDEEERALETSEEAPRLAGAPMLTLGAPVAVRAHDEPRPVTTAGLDPYAEPPAPSAAATPANASSWNLDDEEPATLERAAPLSTSAATATDATTATTAAGEPECPSCGGPMWDNRPKKEAGQYKKNAPDFGCRDRDCGGKLWPGQWPPKPKDAVATQEDIQF